MLGHDEGYKKCMEYTEDLKAKRIYSHTSVESIIPFTMPKEVQDEIETTGFTTEYTSAFYMGFEAGVNEALRDLNLNPTYQ